MNTGRFTIFLLLSNNNWKMLQGLIYAFFSHHALTKADSCKRIQRAIKTFMTRASQRIKFAIKTDTAPTDEISSSNIRSLRRHIFAKGYFRIPADDLDRPMRSFPLNIAIVNESSATTNRCSSCSLYYSGQRVA